MPKNAQKWGIYKDGIKVLANFGLECGQMTSRHFIGFGMIKQDHLAGKLSARHHVPHLVAEPLRLLARRGVVVQPLLDHPVPDDHGDNYFAKILSFSPSFSLSCKNPSRPPSPW